MKVALETLLKDLVPQLEACGLQPIKDQEIQLPVSDPDMITHAQLPFYDPKNCDGFKHLSETKQATVAKTMVDANTHPFSTNVGIALWNATVRALYMVNNPKSALADKENSKFIESQYLYMDNQRHETVDSKIGQNKMTSPTHTPNIVDQRTLGFAKSYQTFINTLVNDADPLKDLRDNIGYVGMAMFAETFKQNEAKAKKGFRDTQAELKARITLYETRARVNALPEGEYETERQALQAAEEKSKKPASIALAQYRHYFDIAEQISQANGNIALNDPKRSYAEKIATVNQQIETVERLVQTLPTPASLQKTIDGLSHQHTHLPTDPVYMLPQNYLLALAKDTASNGYYDPSSIITRSDRAVVNFFCETLQQLHDYQTKIENAGDDLKKTQHHLEALSQALQELDNINSALRQDMDSLVISSAELDYSAMNPDDLSQHEAHFKKMIDALAALKIKLSEKNVAKKFDDPQAQAAFDNGLEALQQTALYEIQTRSEQYETQLQSIRTQIRKNALAAAQGSLDALIQLKQNADSLLGIHSNTSREIQKSIMRQTTSLRVAQESIGVVNKKYAGAIAATESQIAQLAQALPDTEILVGEKSLTQIAELETLKNKLLEAKASVEKTGIPVEKGLFEQLTAQLNWNSEAARGWEYIQHNSTATWLTRTASKLYLSHTPEQPLLGAIEQRVKAIEASINTISSVEKKKVYLARLNAALEKNRAPYMGQKAEAEMSIAESRKALAVIQQEISVQQESISSANNGFDKLLNDCLVKLQALELTRENLAEIKGEFVDLSKRGSSTFAINRFKAYGEFKKLYAAKEIELSKREQALNAPALNAEPAAIISAANIPVPAPEIPVPAPKNLLLEKFHVQTTQYLDKRAAKYSVFDSLDSAVTSGMKFFSCGNSKAKTDQEARIDYLAKISRALETNTEASLKHAYNLVAKVLNDPTQFPARAAKGTDAYNNSMRALLTNLMTDLRQHPVLTPIIEQAAEEARLKKENPVYWQPH